MSKYELRTLCSQDIFPMMRIISKIGIKEFKSAFESADVKELISSGEKDKDKLAAAVGMGIALDVGNIILCNLPNAENEIYTFLSSVSGMSKDDIKKLDMGTFVEMIIDIVKKDEFKDFFKVVSGLLKSEK